MTTTVTDASPSMLTPLRCDSGVIGWSHGMMTPTHTEDSLCPHAFQLLLRFELTGSHLRLKLLILHSRLLQLFLQFGHDLNVSFYARTDKLTVS